MTLPPGARLPLFHTPVSLVVVCVTLSTFVQMMDAPRPIVMVCGWKARLCITALWNTTGQAGVGVRVGVRVVVDITVNVLVGVFVAQANCVKLSCSPDRRLAVLHE